MGQHSSAFLGWLKFFKRWSHHFAGRFLLGPPPILQTEGNIFPSTLNHKSQAPNIAHLFTKATKLSQKFRDEIAWSKKYIQPKSFKGNHSDIIFIFNSIIIQLDPMGVMKYYQPKQCTNKWEIHQIYHIFALFDALQIGNFMIPVQDTSRFHCNNSVNFASKISNSWTVTLPAAA